MGILSTLLNKSQPKAGIANPWNWNRYFYGSDYLVPSSAGQWVTPDSVKRVSAVYACVKVLSEDVAKLPFFLYRRLPNGGREKAEDHYLYQKLHSRPNPWQTSFEWREMMMGHALLRGNAYSFIRKNSDLIPLHPDRVRPELVNDSYIVYWYRNKDGEESLIQSQNIWHLRGMSSDGVCGDSVIAAMRESVGLAMAADTHGSRFFKNAAQVPFALMHPDTLSQDAYERLRSSWDSEYGGAENAGKTPVFEEGMKIEKIGLTNEDSQFLETREFQVLDIARFFRMPPHKIQSMKDATFSNIEHQSIEYVVDTLMPWATRFEQTTARDLIDQENKFFVELELKALLRGDMEARSNFYNQAIQAGWMSRNEVRRLENMDPGPSELDEFLQMRNMGVAGEEMEPQPLQQPSAVPDEDDADEDEEASVARSIAAKAARRYARQEIAAVLKSAPRYAKNPKEWERWLSKYYRRFASSLVDGLMLTETAARRYCSSQIEEIISNGVHVVEGWEDEKAAALEALAFRRE